MVDDSIVRGTTTRGLVALVRAAGAREVHMRVSSPPVTGPCYYGIDTPTRSELIAASNSVEDIRRFIEADTLAYLSRDGMYAYFNGQDQGFCDVCFTANYPVHFEDEGHTKQLHLFDAVSR
jgi:amidophosphoribosyltransferase